MSRRRDTLTCLSAWYAKRFPTRPDKTAFSDEILVLADMFMAQIDPDGTKPLILPPMPAYEGLSDQYTAKPTGNGGARHGD